MAFPRIVAVVFVLLIIGSISLVVIGGVGWIGPTLAHGTNVQHRNGKIVEIGPERDFVLETADKQRTAFQCRDQCRASLGHLQRHRAELAATDVYYIEGPNNVLLALDVD